MCHVPCLHSFFPPMLFAYFSLHEACAICVICAYGRDYEKKDQQEGKECGIDRPRTRYCTPLFILVRTSWAEKWLHHLPEPRFLCTPSHCALRRCAFDDAPARLRHQISPPPQSPPLPLPACSIPLATAPTPIRASTVLFCCQIRRWLVLGFVGGLFTQCCHCQLRVRRVGCGYGFFLFIPLFFSFLER